MPELSALGEAIQNSAFGLWASQSSLAYPLANVVHLLGLVMLVGGIGILDLRLAGLFRRIPVAPLSAALTPIALIGLALMALTGPVMFAADAAALVDSATFRWKLALIAVALSNALAFRWLWRRHWDNWDATAPTAARVMALASMSLWLAAGTLGRMIAYW